MVTKSETLGNVFVEVASAKVEAAKGETPARLVIDLRITNRTGSPIDFDPWAGPMNSEGFEVKDDTGTIYGALSLQSPAHPTVTIPPHKTVNETLIVAEPKYIAKRLQLQLPGKNVGISGEFVLDCTPLGGCGPKHCTPPSTDSTSSDAP